MLKLLHVIGGACGPIVVTLAIATGGVADAEPSRAPIRGPLLRAERLSPELVDVWKQRGASAVAVIWDEAIPRDEWAKLSETVAHGGLRLYVWVEVGRNPELANAHPEWMASPGGHHDDWRRRFPGAPAPRRGEVVKLWPWVPIGYAPAFDAHRERLVRILDDLPGPWAGVLLNDLQGGPSSCGCGNDQCRWALDYGAPATAPRLPGHTAAARLVVSLRERYPDRAVIPVWVTECEDADRPEAQGGTGLCGGVPCARGECWPQYARQWNPLVAATSGGPIALAGWVDAFQREPDWLPRALGLFRNPPRGGTPLRRNRALAVIPGWDTSAEEQSARIDQAQPLADGWLIALDPIDQTWAPRVIAQP